MPALAYVLGYIIFSFVLCLFVGRFMKAGAGPGIKPDKLPARDSAASHYEGRM